MKKLYLMGAIALATALSAAALTDATQNLPAKSGGVKRVESQADNNDGIIYQWPAVASAPTAVTPETENPDYTGWTYYKIVGGSWSIMSDNQYKVMPANGENDQWLVSPVFTAKKGNEYTITFAYKGTNASTYTIDAHFLTGHPAFGINSEGHENIPDNHSTTFKNGAFTITAKSDGSHFFALHIEKGNTLVVLKDINISVIEHSESHTCVGKETPCTLTPEVEEGEFAGGWSQINKGESSEKWTPENITVEGETFCGAVMHSSWGKAKDDYLVSPRVHMDEGETYIMQYTWKTDNYKESMDVYIAPRVSDSGVLGGEKIKTHDKDQSDTWTTTSVSYTSETTADNYIVFHANSEMNANGIYIASVSVDKYEFKPAAVGGLKAERGENRALTCRLSWTLPTTDYAGNAFADDQTVTKVEIYRDDVLCKTFESAEKGFEDNADNGLTAGVHTYKVIAYVGEAAGEDATITTEYIGEYPAVTMPGELAITAETFDQWLIMEGAANAIENKWHLNSAALELTIPKDGVSEHFIVTPGLSFDEPGYYTFEIKAQKDYDQPAAFSFLLGTTTDVADMSAFASGFDIPQGKEYKAVAYDFYIPAAGTYYVAIKEALGKAHASNNTYRISGAAVIASEWRPGVVTDVTAVADPDEEGSLLVSWTNPEKDFAGQPMGDKEYKVEVYLNDAGAPAATVEDGASSVSVPVTEGGIFIVTVRTANTDGVSAPVAATVKSSWVGAGEAEADHTVASGFAHWNTDESGAWAISGDAWTVNASEGADAYLVSTPLDVKANNIYKLTFSHANAGQSSSTLEVLMGHHEDHKDFVHVSYINVMASDYNDHEVYVVGVDPAAPAAFHAPARANSQEVKELFDKAIQVQPGSNRIALHATKAVNAKVKSFGYHQAAVYDITDGIEEIVTDKVAFDGSALSFEGTADVAVYNLAGVCVASVQGAEGSFLFDGFDAGYYIVKVTTVSESLTLKVTL